MALSRQLQLNAIYKLQNIKAFASYERDVIILTHNIGNHKKKWTPKNDLMVEFYKSFNQELNLDAVENRRMKGLRNKFLKNKNQRQSHV